MKLYHYYHSLTGHATWRRVPFPVNGSKRKTSTPKGAAVWEHQKHHKEPRSIQWLEHGSGNSFLVCNLNQKQRSLWSPVGSCWRFWWANLCFRSSPASIVYSIRILIAWQLPSRGGILRSWTTNNGVRCWGPFSGSAFPQKHSDQWSVGSKIPSPCSLQWYLP